MTMGADAGAWFHGGGMADPAGAAQRRWQALSALVAQRRREAADLQGRLTNLQRQIAALEALKAEGAAGTAPAAGGEPAAAFWSPVPMLGFRMWRLTPAGALGFVQRWDRPRLEAVCRRGPGAPHEDGCRCGIYAWKDIPQPWRAGQSLPPIALYGLVALSGKVVEHEDGYRAQRAEVVAGAVVVGRAGALACGSDPAWLEGLFQPGGGWEPATTLAGARRRRAPLAEGIDYLLQEARRFGERWTSESRSA